MGVRVSATDWVEGGWTVSDAIAFARELRVLGCDYVTPSSGGSTPEQNIRMGPGYQADFAAQIRAEAGMPTMAVGLINDARFAEYLVASGKCDMVAIGRGMVENPRWPWDAAKILDASVNHPRQYMRGDKPVWRYSSLVKK
jgi:2,4-dienoyl-CoA reductase-like NADH-dependent reductase (Old Yellow Enzyme family)